MYLTDIVALKDAEFKHNDFNTKDPYLDIFNDDHKYIIHRRVKTKNSAMNELKEKTFASILELDTKSKIEIFRILKRHANNEQTMEWYDQVLTRLKNNEGLVPA